MEKILDTQETTLSAKEGDDIKQAAKEIREQIGEKERSLANTGD